MKLNVKEILSDAFAFYKGNWKRLVGLSVFMTLCAFPMYGMSGLEALLKPLLKSQTPLEQAVPMLMTWTIYVYAILIPLLFFAPKVMMTFYIFVNVLLGKKPCTFREAYIDTKGKYWLCVGYALLMGIAYVALMQIPFLPGAMYGLIIQTLWFALVGAFFYTVIPQIAIESKGYKYLRKTWVMQKGNFRKLVLLQFLTLGLLSLVVGISNLLFPAQAAIIQLVHVLLYGITYPFYVIVATIVYRILSTRRYASR